MTLLNFEENPNKTILIFGAANLDIVAKSNALPQTKGISIGSEIRTGYGGVARNVAENLARLGESVTLITSVGGDGIGEQLLEHTAISGVDTTACNVEKTMRTASYMAIYSRIGELQYAFEDMDVFSALTSAYIKDHQTLFDKAKLIFIDANLPATSMKTIFSLARKAKVPVCADATSMILAEKLTNYIDRMYLLTANTKEAALLCGRKELKIDQDIAKESARHLINSGAQICVIPMAEFGVCYATSQTSGSIPAMRTQITDPTGAGDALTATVIYGLVNNISLDDTIRLGVTAASITLRHPGTVYPALTLESLYDELVF